MEKILKQLSANGKLLDLIICIGDDRSDENMFWSLNDEVARPPPDVFACTVGQKPSSAKYYIEDTDEVLELLSSIVETQLGSAPNEQ